MDYITCPCRRPKCPMYGQMAPRARLKMYDWQRQGPRFRCERWRVVVSATTGTAYAGICTDLHTSRRGATALAEGLSIRTTGRLLDVDKDTVNHWLPVLGPHCQGFCRKFCSGGHGEAAALVCGGDEAANAEHGAAVGRLSLPSSTTSGRFLLMGMNAMPTRGDCAASNALPPTMGRVSRLTARWSWATRGLRSVTWRNAIAGTRLLVVALHGGFLGVMAVHRARLGDARPPDGLREPPSCRLFGSMFSKHKVQGLAVFVDGARERPWPWRSVSALRPLPHTGRLRR
jgi:transposase-like protein